MRDRRSARASVIERVAEVEEAFETSRWASPEDEPPFGTSQMAKLLGALEAACLVAGVPRPVLNFYTLSIQLYEDSQRISQTAMFIGNCVAQGVNENLVVLCEKLGKDELIAGLMNLSADIKALQEKVRSMHELTFGLHDTGLGLLSMSLWHPVVFQFLRRSLNRFQRSTDQFEKGSREFATVLRSMENTYSRLSRGNSKLKAVESPTIDHAEPAQEQNKVL